MKLITSQFVFLLMIMLILTSCESEYSRTVKKELASGEIYEDLLFDMKVGETQKDFYDKCWTLNKEKIISQGPGNKYARYIALLDSTEENSAKADMLFYGIFDKEKVMYGMEMVFSYIQWAPWNKDFHAPKLVEDLKKKYLKEYPGNKFIEVKINDDVNAQVKVDGNRQILLYPLGNKDVKVKITDLRHPENPINNSEKK